MQRLLISIAMTFIFFLPAGIANMMPVLVSKVPFLNVPMDGGHSFRGKRIFGDHKTWRGFVFGIVGGGLANVVLASGVTTLFGDFSPSIFWDAFKLGAVLGAGALLGDAVKSFFKRQLNIAPGKSWVPFDQVDWILGGLVAVHFFDPHLPAYVWIQTLLLFGLLHPIINIIGYVLRIKKKMF